MVKLVFLLILSFTLFLNANAQFTQGAKDSASSEIQQLTSDWNNAIIHRDSLALDQLLAPDYSLNGIVQRKAWMENSLHHILSDSLNTVGPLKITYYGQVVKSEGMFFWKASFDGKQKINGAYSITDIWIRRNGQWQVLLRMSLPAKLE